MPEKQPDTKKRSKSSYIFGAVLWTGLAAIWTKEAHDYFYVPSTPQEWLEMEGKSRLIDKVGFPEGNILFLKPWSVTQSIGLGITTYNACRRSAEIQQKPDKDCLTFAIEQAFSRTSRSIPPEKPGQRCLIYVNPDSLISYKTPAGETVNPLRNVSKKVIDTFIRAHEIKHCENATPWAKVHFIEADSDRYGVNTTKIIEGQDISHELLSARIMYYLWPFFEMPPEKAYEFSKRNQHITHPDVFFDTGPINENALYDASDFITDTLKDLMLKAGQNRPLHSLSELHEKIMLVLDQSYQEEFRHPESVQAYIRYSLNVIENEIRSQPKPMPRAALN